jgi:acetyltransferase-like isoleucine patch superfamily enzyme
MTVDPTAFVHADAIVEPGASVGAQTRVWAFAHILPGAVIGNDCNICDGVFMEGGAVVGDRVTVKCGVQLWEGVQLEDDVFVGPNATFTNDRFPRSKQYPEQYLTTFIRRGASVGANATILPGLEIGTNAMVGAGAVVTRNVPPNAIVVGNPARIQGYVSSIGNTRATTAANRTIPGDQPTTVVGGAQLYRLPEHADMRGDLSVGEVGKEIPFVPQRYFLVYNVPTKEVRGEHAHRRLHQFMVCLKGSCSVVLDDGTDRTQVILDTPTLGLYVPPLLWTTQYNYSGDAILLVLASAPYSPADYIRNYDDYLTLVRTRD